MTDRVTQAEIAQALRELRYLPIRRVGAVQNGSAHYERDNDAAAQAIVQRIKMNRNTHRRGHTVK